MNTAPLKRLIVAFDNISHSTGEAFSWAIIILVFGISYEVIMRYLFNSPTSWAFDMSFILYGALFMMAGAYTLSKGEHVRGDFMYQRWNPTTQAKVDLILYLVFLDGILSISLQLIVLHFVLLHLHAKPLLQPHGGEISCDGYELQMQCFSEYLQELKMAAKRMVNRRVLD